MRISLRFFLALALAATLASCSLLTNSSLPLIQEPASATLASQARATATLPRPQVETVPSQPLQPAPGEIPTERPLQAAPSETPTSQPTETPPAYTVQQLTQGGCCVNPFWSADSQRVFYVDRPSAQDPSGIWGVGLEGGQPQFVTDRLGTFSNDQKLRAFPSGGQTIVERISDGARWTIPNSGRAITFSPDDTRVAWVTGRSQPPYDSAERQVWVAQVDGSGARRVITALSAGIAGWSPDGSLLISGILTYPETGQALWLFTPPQEGQAEWTQVELARAERIRGASLSPDGSWLVYISAFSGDPAEDGIWLIDIHSLEKRRLDQFGAYAWRDANRLLLIPLDLSQPYHRILQVDAPSGQISVLTDPANSPFKISNGDWSVSPDGRHVAFVSAQDRNIWLINFNDR